MSFWSRNKNKKDTPTSTTPPQSEGGTGAGTGIGRPPQSIPLPVSSSPATLAAATAANGSSPNPPPPQQPPSMAVKTNGISTPPDSPSTITGVRGGPSGPSPSPWSMRKFRNANPFPRFSHAANVSAGKEGEIYVFGGLVKDKRKNDLFVIDSGSMTAYNISATGDGPSPRLGHSAILVGNAFIVFGGECASTDLSHDDSLYLLNTSTRQWTRAATVGPRPAPRYGHTLNILGSRLLVFGGQVDGYYFNDLVTFDLNTLSSTNARWELVQAVTDPPSARTGHICLSLGDKLVIFGGTDGLQWFNDTWFFDARSNSWVEIECSGHIPSPREGHAAALAGDVVYIFGGRGSDGTMLSDLYAFKLSSRRWFSFKSMGIGPSPRCGHTMTTSRDKLIILGGESATNVAGKDESTVAFILDTSKIRFPSDSTFPTSVPSTMTKQPSSASSSKVRNLTSPPPERVRTLTSPPPLQQPQQSFRPTSRGNTESPRVNAEEPPRSAGSRSKIRSPSPPRGGAGGSLKSRGEGERSHVRSSSGGSTPQSTSSVRARTTTPPNIQIGGMAQSQLERPERPERPERSVDRQIERPVERVTSAPSTDRQTFDRPPTDRAIDRNIERSTPIDRQPLSQKQIQPQVNGIPLDFPLITSDENTKSSQTPVQEDIESNGGDQSPSEPKHSETHADDTSTPSLQSSPQLTSAPTIDDLKKRLAWMTTELALAQSRGYTPEQYPDDDELDFLGTQEFQVKDTKLLQALLSTRHQLARVKELVKDQTRTASERISEAERQRDEALADASYVRARLAAAQSGDESPPLDDRATDLSKKLVIALAIQNDLTLKLEGLESQLQVEKMARQVAEETAQSHLGKYDDAEQRRKEGWTQLEELREQHADVQRVAAEERTRSVDHVAVAGNLRVEAEELQKQVAEMTEVLDAQTNAVKATKTSITSAVERAEAAENSLQSERLHRIELEKEIVQLKQQLGSLDDHQSRIDDLEHQLKLAREEADSHRNVMLTKLDTIVNRSSPTTSPDYEGRIRTLQDHLDSTKSLHAESRQQLDTATHNLSKANERIATLESSQSQSVRQLADLQSRLSETIDQFQHLQGEHTKIRSRMTDVQRDLDASYVKHSAIKQLFSERPSSSSPARGTGTPEFSSKIRELERQLEESGRLREELESSQEQVMQNLSVASKRHKEATRRQRDAEDRVKKLEEELERASNISGSGSGDVAEANRRTVEAEKKLADSTVVFQDRLTQLEADYQSAVHYVKGTEKMIRRMKEELTKYKSQNAFLQSELHELKRQSFKGSDEEQQGWEAEKERMVKEIEALQVAQKSESLSASEQIKLLQTKLDQHAEERDILKSQLSTIQKDYQSATERTKQIETQLQRFQDDNLSKSRLETELSLAKAASKRLEQENESLETRALEAEEKVSLLLDQVESSVDTYRRSIVAKRTEERNSPPISPHSSSVGNRTSVALDSLAHELDQLRSHWESSTHRYRLSTASSIGGNESPTRSSAPTMTTTGLGLHPFDFDQSRVTPDDASTKINGLRLDSPRWRDDIDAQVTPTQTHFRQVTA